MDRSPPSISLLELYSPIGGVAAPPLLNVRPVEVVQADGKTIVGAIHRPPEQASCWISHLPTRSRSSLLLAAVIALPGWAGALAAPQCEPALSLMQYQFAPQRMSVRTWTARIAVDATRCASAAGPFNMDFVRGREEMPDQPFTQQFTWTPGQVEVSMNLQHDELLVDFSIGDVAACPCRQ
jgi:hypothetical protein